MDFKTQKLARVLALEIVCDVERNLVSGKSSNSIGGGGWSCARAVNYCIALTVHRKSHQLPLPKYQPLHVPVPAFVTTIGRLALIADVLPVDR